MQDGPGGGNLRMKLQSINDLMYLYYTILLCTGETILSLKQIRLSAFASSYESRFD